MWSKLQVHVAASMFPFFGDVAVFISHLDKTSQLQQTSSPDRADVGVRVGEECGETCAVSGGFTCQEGAAPLSEGSDGGGTPAVYIQAFPELTNTTSNG